MDNSLPSVDTHYDYIIAGAGCAGLSLLYQLMQSPTIKDKRILVIDRSFQKSNDRTWCFWEEGAGVFENLVCKQWETISIHSGHMHKPLSTRPFTYKMIQGIDYYQYIIGLAKMQDNIHWREANITDITTEDDNGVVHFESGKQASAAFVFSSIVPKQFQASFTESADRVSTVQQKNEKPFLWQHFKGILVDFDMPIFDAQVARLMDFNVPQKGATAFMYILPLTDSKALVEYTLFSEQLLSTDQYDEVLQHYLSDMIHANAPAATYKILHEELGAIPMTQQSFSNNTAPIHTIGTLSGAVKASTGYAFHFIQEQTKQVVQQLEQGLAIETNMHDTRHYFYDAVLLHILKNHKMEGKEIFSRIFSKNKAATIFKFLSNTSNIFEDIQIMRSLPTRIFLPAAISVLLRRG